MKHASLILLLLSFFKLQSQNLILTQAAYEPAVGDSSFYNVMDTSAMIGGLPNQVTGSICNWNFIDLTATPLKANAAYVDPSAVPEASAFPACNLVQKQGTLRNYYKSTSTPSPQTEMLGINSSSIILTFTNTAVIARFPISYGTNFSDNIAGTFVFSVSGSFTGTMSSTADGSGTLWLPGGQALHNVLRVKSVQTLNLLLGFIPFGTAKQVVYNYFHASQKFPILNVTYSSVLLLGSSTPSTSAVITGNSKSIYMALDENRFDSKAVKVFPNPAVSLIQVQWGQSLAVSSLELIDAGGQSIFIYRGSPLQDDAISIDISAYPPGLYLLKLNGAEAVVYKKVMLEH